MKRKLSILPLELQTSNQLDSQNQEAHERCSETDARMRDPGEGTEANAAAEFTSPLAANEIITAGINADAEPTTSAAANEIITAGIAAMFGGEAPKSPTEAHKPPTPTPTEAPKPPTDAPKPPWRWHSSKRRLEEGDNDPTWLARKKHFFILSDAGKPIYSRCADVRI